jgi:ornithine cyclodeaminase/alanine dehydrogenase-like protein (mu-crystallin family)
MPLPSPSGPDNPTDLILLSGRDLEQLVQPTAALEALRHTYEQLANNPADQGRSIGFAVSRGSIHVKAGLLPGLHAAFATKVNVNLPDNWAIHRLPTIQGVVLLVDAVNGRPLAIMESMALTGLRTAATAALAATFGARMECTPASGQGPAADLTICRACSCSNLTGLRYPSAEWSRLLL